METKDQLNQNPEEVNKPNQEENSKSVKKTENKAKKKSSNLLRIRKKTQKKKNLLEKK